MKFIKKLLFLNRFTRGNILIVISGAVLAGTVILLWNRFEKPLDLSVTIVGTLVAAWAGGWAAFSAERNTRDDAERNTRISSANKAIFTIATMFNAFNNLRQHYVDFNGLRDKSTRSIDMDSPQPGMMQSLHFDFDSLNYFLGQDGESCSMALMQLQVLDWHYQVLVSTVELRAKAAEDLHLAVRTKPIENMDFTTLKTVFRAEYQKLDALTEQFVATVDEGLRLTKEANKTFQTALQIQFPTQRFLQINFQEKPRETGP